MAALFRDEEMIQSIERFVRGYLPTEFDNSVATGLIVLKHLTPPGRFAAFTDTLVKAAPAERAGYLKTFLASGLPDPVGSLTPEGNTAFKVWDGFTMTIFDDGFQVTYGSFRYWEDRQRRPDPTQDS
jgi:hypothetical protein